MAKLNALQLALLHPWGFKAEVVDPSRHDDSGLYTAGIDVTAGPRRELQNAGSDTWWSQIECHGVNSEEARVLRDFVVAAINEKIDHMTMAEFKLWGQEPRK